MGSFRKITSDLPIFSHITGGHGSLGLGKQYTTVLNFQYQNNL